jgi:hypothetical protein
MRAILQTESQSSQERRILLILLAEMRGEYFILLTDRKRIEEVARLASSTSSFTKAFRTILA